MADPFNLNRFIDAQLYSYAAGLSELKAGEKRSHWMWFIFPQIAGLGRSPIAREYAIKSVEEVRAYLDHPVLGARLIACTRAVIEIRGKPLSAIFGYPDNLKFCSSMTLFEYVSPAGCIFSDALEQCCGGERDARTVAILEAGQG
ncbi:MAG: DUF1810 domain-containing protein [Zetaproteobacteria bacterium CG12_big_fil_rev_8_21_14_0_65_54_13]|nr:MAG: DUF1810 domain-containing protein [Zetaproteobacteria bacterium CG12_big_fil_rev_8_21_14_0_65_54_13]PIX53704.1 MAG: DUF1810 domain-containing protein [Zetaproteobacteria bacterium CG_4_10_14_3_um_filter_54_28]PJA31201.1 MAG: DUF1810 domain-containing protein [Zetaproteobacteria bacterium CG_4_9_14_3_um_filter_54_145]